MIVPEKIPHGLYLWYMAFSGVTTMFVSVIYGNSGKDATLSVTKSVVNGNPRKYTTMSVDVAVAYGNPG